MVGLSVVLEGHDRSVRNSSSSSSCSSPSQVVNKSSMIKTTSPSSPSPSSSNPFSRRSYSLPTNRNLPSISFLDHCFLCRQRLLPGKDIYMYKGDRAFCSEECRCRQIFMDEEESIKAKKNNCSLAAINKPHHASSSSSSSSPSSPSPSSSSSSSRASATRKGASKRANGFAY